MRNWKICCIASLLVLYGCATSDGLKTTAISERNIDNLARLNLGMSVDQVLGIMRDPYEGESFQFSEDQYDVWFYVVHPTVLGQTRMVPFNLTPLIFRNKILVGMGYGYYNWLKGRSSDTNKSQLTPEQNRIKEEIKNKRLSADNSLLSMCSSKKPDTTPNSPKEQSDPPPSKSSPPQKDVEINEEDEEMMQDESDQNFNFW